MRPKYWYLSNALNLEARPLRTHAAFEMEAVSLVQSFKPEYLHSSRILLAIMTVALLAGLLYSMIPTKTYIHIHIHKHTYMSTHLYLDLNLYLHMSIHIYT